MIKREKSDLTIVEAFNVFVQDRIVRGVSKSSLENYNEMLRFFLKELNLDIDTPVSNITETTCNLLVTSMQNRNLSLGSINAWIGRLRVFFYYCMDNGYIKPFKIRLVKGQENKIKFYNEEELSKLLEKPKSNATFVEWRTYVIICFIMSTGARVGTIVNIKLEDVDFKNSTVTYTHLKNKQIAIIPLTSNIQKILINYLSMWQREKEDGWLFCLGNEDQLTTNAITLSLEEYCKKRGVPRKGPHALRHSFAREYIRSGGNAFALQRMLCHSTLEMTKHYVNLFSDDIRNEFENHCPLDNLVKTKTYTIRRK